MDRNTILAFALSLAVYGLWLFYQTSREVPETDFDAAQHIAEQAPTPGVTQEDDARVIPPRDSGSRQPSERETSPAGREPVSEIALWEGVFEGQEFTARLSNRGATLTQWTLGGFHELDASGQKGDQIELVNVDAANPRALAMPFSDLGLGDLSTAVYEVESESADGVTFRLVRGTVEIRKAYRFDLDGYGFELLVEVTNGGEHLVAPDFAIEWPAVVREGNDYNEQALIALHSEDVEKEPLAGVGDPGFFSRIVGNDGEEVVWREIAWTGIDLKYFASLILPDPIAGTRVDFEPRAPGESAATVLRFAPLEIAPGQAASRRLTSFLGPKEPELLESVGREVNKSVDLGYSWFEPLTRFFQWLLKACYGFVPNYGWSIILITILVRVLTLPILNKQMKSMEKMRALQPRLKELQAEFSDDKQKQSEATMALYKETGVNPLGGCFPMLLQFPVFIGLFFALQSSFALRQAPFVLWINDLSAPEVLFVLPGLDFPLRLLPLIMGASMVLQQKLTPTTVDPSQQTMMMVMMPVMMTVLFYQFPSGLVLYWMISNFLGIAHQMLVGRRMKRDE